MALPSDWGQRFPILLSLRASWGLRVLRRKDLGWRDQVKHWSAPPCWSHLALCHPLPRACAPPTGIPGAQAGELMIGAPGEGAGSIRQDNGRPRSWIPLCL